MTKMKIAECQKRKKKKKEQMVNKKKQQKQPFIQNMCVNILDYSSAILIYTCSHAFVIKKNICAYM
jgi:hypothetical protein